MKYREIIRNKISGVHTMVGQVGKDTTYILQGCEFESRDDVKISMTKNIECFYTFNIELFNFLFIY